MYSIVVALGFPSLGAGVSLHDYRVGSMYHVGSVWSHFAWIRWSQSEFPPEYEGGLRGDVKLKTVG